MHAKKSFVLMFALVLLLGCSPAPTPEVKVVEKVVEKTIEVEKEVFVEKVITPTPAQAQELKKILVPLGWLNNDEFAALQVAQKKGFFAEVGLDPTLLSGGASTGLDPITGINGFENSMRIGVPAALSLAIRAYSEGVDVLVVGSLMQYEPSGFIALTKNGRHATGPCDFKDGAVVSMQEDGMWYVGALAKLCDEEPRIEGKDFTLIPAGYTPDCLTSGQCDFYCAWATNQVFMLDQAGMVKGVDYEMFLTSDYAPFYYGDPVVTTHKFAQENSDLVRAFVKATMKGLAYTVDNPDEAIKIAGNIGGVDPEHAKWRIPIQNALSVSDDTEQYGLGYVDIAKVQAMIDFMYENGDIQRTFSASEIVDNSFVTK
jgi:ABC-type nitrate/sulfonate/bicarbonate transport system substrate-binding protein